MRRDVLKVVIVWEKSSGISQRIKRKLKIGLLRRPFHCSRKETIICNTRLGAKEESVRECTEDEIDGWKGDTLIWNESKQFYFKVLTRYLVTCVP